MPDSDMRPVTLRWRNEVRKLADSGSKGIPADWARELGCSKNAISKLLNGEVAKSNLVVPLSELLGVTPTRPRDPGSLYDQVCSEIELADEDLLRAVLSILKNMRR